MADRDMIRKKFLKAAADKKMTNEGLLDLLEDFVEVVVEDYMDAFIAEEYGAFSDGAAPILNEGI